MHYGQAGSCKNLTLLPLMKILIYNNAVAGKTCDVKQPLHRFLKDGSICLEKKIQTAKG